MVPGESFLGSLGAETIRTIVVRISPLRVVTAFEKRPISIARSCETRGKVEFQRAHTMEDWNAWIEDLHSFMLRSVWLSTPQSKQTIKQAPTSPICHYQQGKNPQDLAG